MVINFGHSESKILNRLKNTRFFIIPPVHILYLILRQGSGAIAHIKRARIRRVER